MNHLECGERSVKTLECALALCSQDPIDTMRVLSRALSAHLAAVDAAYPGSAKGLVNAVGAEIALALKTAPGVFQE